MNKQKTIKSLALYTLSITLLFASQTYADDWTCTDVASIKSENTVLACGVATADTEGEAREKALRRARTEFELICETSAECVGRQTIVEPLRNSCETLANGRYKCFRGLRYTILNVGKAIQPPRQEMVEQPVVRPPVTPPPPREAERTAFLENKKFAIGISSYNLTIRHKLADGDEEIEEITDELDGLAFFLQAALGNSTGLKLNFYSLEHEDASQIEVSGYDAQLLFANSFWETGWKFYLGVGYYSETWEYAILSQDFSGPQLNLGMGYNWSSLSLDLNLGLRESSDYTDFVQENVSEELESTASVVAFELGFRF